MKMTMTNDYYNLTKDYKRQDIYHFLYFLTEVKDSDYKESFREYWSPIGPDYGLSRCMPWGAFTVLTQKYVYNEIVIDTVYESIKLVKDTLGNPYVKIGQIYYTFAWDFSNIAKELDSYVYNALLYIISNGVLHYNIYK